MFEPPSIENEDVQWACQVLGLPPTAFTGTDGSDPRAAVLLTNESLDIEACPGSGKTTLLVAKLAILARKWKSRRSGICVVSHTNAARHEIERCLGETPEGMTLLSYPHFVGTIHGFVNEFLAIPWLRSLGYPITAIDDALCEQHRRRLLNLNRYATLRGHVNFKEQHPNANYVGSWQVASPDFLVCKDTGAELFANSDSPSAQQLTALAKQCTEDGFYKYEELFMWADDLLNKHKDVPSTMRQRFPLLFIDEVQDNSEKQSRLLQRIFMDSNDPVRRQRFGDSNQAIYAHVQATGAQSDQFPIDAIRRDIPNSHRFGQQIANLADPLALTPQNLQGLGPPTHTIQADTAEQHAVLLFNDDAITDVLDGYGSILCEVFSATELRAGTFSAVGGVHRPGDDTNLPRFIGHYWPDYDHELSYREPSPGTFHQYVAAGWHSAGDGGDVHGVVERIADAVLRAVQIADDTANLGNRKRKHRYVLECLESSPELKARYTALVLRLIHDEQEISGEEWQDTWIPVIHAIAEKLSGDVINPTNLDEFFVWPAEPPAPGLVRRVRRKDNRYRYPAEDHNVSIRVGSIHSVKGETHTATLVLDTFFHDHHFNALRPWLLGERVGQENAGQRMQSRLKQHYVAFTRPTHLLCIAMRDNLTTEEIDALKARSWRIARVQQGGELAWI